MPVLAVGAAASLGGQVADQVRRYADTVRGEVIEDCGHWLYEERPDEMLALLRDFLRRPEQRSAGALGQAAGVQAWAASGGSSGARVRRLAKVDMVYAPTPSTTSSACRGW